MLVFSAPILEWSPTGPVLHLYMQRQEQNIAPYLPLYRLAQLGWNTVGVHTDPVSDAIWWLVGYGLVMGEKDTA